MGKDYIIHKSSQIRKPMGKLYTQQDVIAIVSIIVVLVFIVAVVTVISILASRWRGTTTNELDINRHDNTCSTELADMTVWSVEGKYTRREM